MTPAIKKRNLQEVCSTFSQNLQGKKTSRRTGWVPVHCSLFGQTFFFPLRSVITGVVPGFPFKVELVHINLEVLRHHRTDWVAFTRELTLGHIGSWPAGSLQLTCVGRGCLWRWWLWGQVSWLWNMGQSDPACVRPDPVNRGSFWFFSTRCITFASFYFCTVFHICPSEIENLVFGDFFGTLNRSC